MNADKESSFVKQIPVEIQVPGNPGRRVQPDKGSTSPERKTEDIGRHYQGYNPGQQTEGNPYKRLGLDSGDPSAVGSGGINPDPSPHDVGLNNPAE